MIVKVIIYAVIFVLFLFGLYFYLITKSRKCENRQCACPIEENLRQGYLVAGALALLALSLIILVEIFLK